MNSSAKQTISPIHHLGQSRLLTTIIALLAVVSVLVAALIFLQRNQKAQPVVSNMTTEQQKAQYINEMQAIASNQPTISSAQKAVMESQMQAVVQNQPALTDEQKAAAIALMQAQLQNNQ